MTQGRVLKDPKEIIAALDMLLKELENSDENYLSEELKTLRERVLYTHSHAEISMETLLTDKLGSMIDMTTFYKRLSFSEKIQVNTEIKNLQPSLIEDLIKLNKARNELAHPKRNQVEKYKQEKVYMDTLACCIRCLMAFRVEFKWRLKATKKESKDKNKRT